MTANPSVTNHIPNWASVDLAPELPMAVFTSMERWNPERIHALALYCSDGRWGEAFDEFCHKHLLIPRYDRLALPGGPACLAKANDQDPVFQATRKQLDFLVTVHDLEKFVLITHYGCAYYSHGLQKSPNDFLAAQAEDVRTAAKALQKWHPKLEVDAYLAMRRENCLSFHRLGT